MISIYAPMDPLSVTGDCAHLKKSTKYLHHHSDIDSSIMMDKYGPMMPLNHNQFDKSVINLRVYNFIQILKVHSVSNQCRAWFCRGVATYTQKRICVHIWTKNMGRFYHTSNFDRICDVSSEFVNMYQLLIGTI